jgi:hypothetical protein
VSANTTRDNNLEWFGALKVNDSEAMNHHSMTMQAVCGCEQQFFAVKTISMMKLLLFACF